MAADSKPLQSKKFVAFLVAEITWKTTLLAVLAFAFLGGGLTGGYLTVAVLVAAIAGFVEVAYINGQAALDRYTQLAKLALDQGKTFQTRDITLGTSDENVVR